MRSNLFKRLSRRNFYRILAAVSILGLFLRLEAARELSRDYAAVTNPSAYTDMYTYQEFAKSIIDGSFDFEQGFYYQPFYYTVFLPVIYRIAGTGHWPVIIVQSLLGAATIWLIGLTFAMLFGKPTGLIGALLVALNRYLIFYTSFTLFAILQSFWISLLVYLALVASRSNKPIHWGLVGVVNGFAVVTRGNALLFVPLILIFVLMRMRGSVRRSICAALLFGVGVVVPQVPYALVNYKAHGKWFGASSAASAVLSLGNTPESPPGGREAETGAGPMEYPLSYHEWIRMDSIDGDARVSVPQQITRWIRDEPLAWLELKFRMFLLFWNKTEIPNNVALPDTGGGSQLSLIRVPFLVDFLVIGSLGIAGMIYSISRRKVKLFNTFTISMIMAYCAATIIFYVLARFRLPMVPLLCGYSGYGLTVFLGGIANRKNLVADSHRRLFSLLVMVFSFVFVGWGYEVYRYQWEATIIRYVRPHGIRIALEDRTVYKDHGPQTFGGWVPVSIVDTAKITKTFKVKPENGNRPRSIALRFPVFARAAGTLKYSVELESDKHQPNWETVTVQPGLHWIETQLSVVSLELESVVVAFFNENAYSDVHLLFDTQRDYRRTKVAAKGTSEFGEWVSELVIYR